MIGMQTFYSQLQRPEQAMTEGFYKLLRISRASLEEVLAVRSALLWEQWPTE